MNLSLLAGSSVKKSFLITQQSPITTTATSSASCCHRYNASDWQHSCHIYRNIGGVSCRLEYLCALGLSPRLPWWILTYRSKYANITKYCGNELILHSTYRFWNLFFIVESDDFIWKNTSFWFQICFCLKYFIFFVMKIAFLKFPHDLNFSTSTSIWDS